MGVQKLPVTEETGPDVDAPFLIVGLGNPEQKYQDNRHNIGFKLIDRLAAGLNVSLSRVQFKALLGKSQLGDRAVLLAKPQTYMNESGYSVNQLMRFYKLPLAHLLVVYDELDLPLGTLRLRSKGGAGGHNGMKSIIRYMGSDFARLRLGVGRPPGRMEPAAFVLRDFKKDELPVVDELLERGVDAAKSFVQIGVDLAMTRHNAT